MTSHRIESVLRASDDELIAILQAADELDEIIVEQHLSLVHKPSTQEHALEVIILGSEGCRFGMLTGKAGGVWLRSAQLNLLLDPGPSTVCIVSELMAINEELRLEKLDAILCSHIHPDHSGDLITCIEGMTCGMKVRRGCVIGNQTVMEKFINFDPYHFTGLRSVILKPGASAKNTLICDREVLLTNNITLDDVEIHPTPTRHFETTNSQDAGIGFFLRTSNGNVWYTSDTSLFDGLIESVKVLYGDEELSFVIANADASIIAGDTDRIDSYHLLTRDVLVISRELRPRCVIIHHYDEAYSSLSYRLAQAVYLQRQLDKEDLPVTVLPSANGLSVVMDKRARMKAQVYSNDEESTIVGEYAHLILGGVSKVIEQWTEESRDGVHPKDS